METIIGLGNAGCNIAKFFSQYPQYESFYIDSEAREEENSLKIPKRTSHEKYESSFPVRKAEEFFKKVKKPCLLIVGGSGTISGCSLRILELLKKKKPHVLYVKPDQSTLSAERKLQDSAVYGVLQEYARSGLIERMFIVDNMKLEEALGDVPIINYYNNLNHLLVSTMHMTNIYSNTKAIESSFFGLHETSRISTFGMMKLDSTQENLFFDLESPRDKTIFYAINKESLENDGSLFRKIKQQVKHFADENLNVSYKIFSTTYDDDYVYSMNYSSFIQK
jgi:hypothetical protein